MGIRGKVGGDYETPESGLQKGRCIKIIDKGTHYNEKFGNHQRELMVMFELPELLMKKGDNAGKPFAVSLGFGGCITLSMNAKSNLRPIIEGWLGKKLNDMEAAEFDIDSLIGKPALINILHTVKDDNTYANIAAVMPLKEVECPDPINDNVVFSISEFNQSVFDTLPENTRKRIEESDEWKFRFNSQAKGEIAQAESRARTDANDEFPMFDENGSEIDIKEIGAEGAAELDRSMINFNEEYKALKSRTWTTINALCKRKMGDSDYKDFFIVGEYGGPDKTFAPEVQQQICKELITVCKARA